MNVIVRCFVAGRPVPKGSFTQARSGAKSWVRPANPALADWARTVELRLLAARPPTPYPGLVTVSLAFWMRRPAAHYVGGDIAKPLRAVAPGWPGTKPDLDKLTRSICDALVRGKVLKDDALVVAYHEPFGKFYAAPDQSQGVMIEVCAKE